MSLRFLVVALAALVIVLFSSALAISRQTTAFATTPTVYTTTLDAPWKMTAPLWNGGTPADYQPTQLQDATLVLDMTLMLETGQGVLISGKVGYGLTDGWYKPGNIALVVHAIEVVGPDGARTQVPGSVVAENITFYQHYAQFPLVGYFVATVAGEYRIEVRAYSATTQNAEGGAALAQPMGKGSFGPFGQLIADVK